jgi:hypothetical protein
MTEVCHYCGSSDLYREHEREGYQARLGCRACNRWFAPVLLSLDRPEAKRVNAEMWRQFHERERRRWWDDRG